MHFGVDYHPEHWVYPYDGTEQDPEARWVRDVELMVDCGVNVVRMGEFAWGLYEREEGKFDFSWMHRCMDLMQKSGIQVVLATPTAAPPIWLLKKYPEILPLDQRRQQLFYGTRHGYTKNSDLYWEYCRKIIRKLAGELGQHPQLIAWQIDNGVGSHNTETSFNDETRKDWHAWLQAKYHTVERLNDQMGLRFWGQVVTRFADVPMPKQAPTPHNPALMLDWARFSSDTCVAFVRMQTDLLHELTPKLPVTTTVRALGRQFDHFDMADAIDFVSMDSDASTRHRASENAMDVDLIRSLKKTGARAPDHSEGFWVMEQKAGQVNWKDVNSLLRPGALRLLTYQSLARGANGILYFFWRQPRIGSEKFYGGVLTHDGRGDNRVFTEIKKLGHEVQKLAPMLAGTTVRPDVAILYSQDNEWALKYPLQPNTHFRLREHVQSFYNALHDRNYAVDFARPSDDLSAYKMVIAPSLHLLSNAEADNLRDFVHNGGVLIATCNTGLVDEHNIVTSGGFPNGLTQVFGIEVREFDVLAPGEENHLIFKAAFASSQAHSARLWCDLIETREDCQVMATFAKDFYAGRPAVTLNQFGLGRAIYVGTICSQPFYYDLIAWARNLAGITPLLKVPESVEVSMRQSGGRRIFFLLNQNTAAARVNFLKPMHDFLSGKTLSGHHDLPANGVLVLDEETAPK